VVDVADRRTAPRDPAALVTEPDQLGETAGEAAAAGVHRDQLSGRGSAVEPAQAGEPGRAGAGNDLASQLGGHGTVVDQVGGIVAGTEQHLVADDQADRHRHSGRGAEDPRAEGVGHHLAPGAGVAGRPRGLGSLAEALEDRDPQRHRELGREPGHGVGGRAQGDPALGLGDPSAQHAGGGVELGRQAARRGFELAVTSLLQPIEISGEAAVDLLPIGQGEARGLAGQDGRLPLRDAALAQGPAGARHLIGQHAGQGHVLSPAVGRLAPGESDLAGDPAAPSCRRDTTVGLGAS
jgi:hypothetical protein